MTDLNRATSALTEVDKYTAEIYVDSDELCTVTALGTWVGTLSVEYRLEQGTAWNVLETKTENGRCDFPGGGDNWRIGFSAFTSGTANVTIQGKRSER